MALLATSSDFAQHGATSNSVEGVPQWQPVMHAQAMPAWSWFVPAVPAGQAMMVAQQVPSECCWGQAQPRSMPAPPQMPAPSTLLTTQHMPPPPSKHANTAAAAKNKKSSSGGATRGRVLFGISGISRLPAIRDSEQSDCPPDREECDREHEPVGHGTVLGPMQNLDTMAQALNDAFLQTRGAQEFGSSTSIPSQSACSQPTCQSAAQEPHSCGTDTLTSPALSPVKSSKGTSWADLYDREEEADDSSSTCDSRSDHLTFHIGAQALSEPSSPRSTPRSSCAFVHVTSQSGDIDNEDVDSHCCPVEVCECANAKCTESVADAEDLCVSKTQLQQPQTQSMDSSERQLEVVEVAPVFPSLPLEAPMPAEVDDAAQHSPSKNQLKKQRKAAAKQADKSATLAHKQSGVRAPKEKEDSIKLSMRDSREQSTAHQKPLKQQKQGQKQIRRTISPEVKSSDSQECVETRRGQSVCRAVLSWLRLFLRLAQKYPVSTVLAVTMLGYGGMMMPGLGHASQPQLPQPGDASLMPSRTLHPKKKALPLADADASPKVRTKSGKSTRKASPKNARHEM